MKKFLCVLLTIVCLFAFSMFIVGCGGEKIDKNALIGVEEKPATCTEGGHIAYWLTPDGKHFYTDSKGEHEIPRDEIFLEAMGHKLIYHEGMQPTAYDDGRKECWECKVCHKIFADAEATIEVNASDLVTESIFKEIDFIVELPVDRDAKILHISDPQIIISEAERTEDRLGGIAQKYWARKEQGNRCYNYLDDVMKTVNPDLVLVTGDLVYGEFDDDGSALLKLIEFMESYNVPWAPVFGNHEIESNMGADWQCEQLEKAEHCLFKQRKLTGNGNYTVGISQGGKLTRVFFMMDSNGCGNLSAQSRVNGHSTGSVGFGTDQINWFNKLGTRIKAASPDTNISFAYHIQQYIFNTAYEQYGFTNSGTKNKPINIDTHPDRKKGDIGIIANDLKSPWDFDLSVYYMMRALGTDSIFVGHEHCISASVMYDGIRFQFGQKASEYDRKNYVVKETGRIIPSYYEDPNKNIPLCGGTVLPMGTDGKFKDPYICYGKGAGREIDWHAWDDGPIKEDKPIVNGIDNSYVYPDAAVTMTVEQFGTDNVFKAVANSQGKVYITASQLANKKQFKFSVYLPSSSNKKLAGLGEFAMRVKPNALTPSGNGRVSGYIDYNSSATDANRKLKFNEWQTFTIDISGFGGGCTEFAFNIAEGNTIYIKDIFIT